MVAAKAQHVSRCLAVQKNPLLNPLLPTERLQNLGVDESNKGRVLRDRGARRTGGLPHCHDERACLVHLRKTKELGAMAVGVCQLDDCGAPHVKN